MVPKEGLECVSALTRDPLSRPLQPFDVTGEISFGVGSRSAPRYTVIDFRALEALGSDSTDRSVNFYLAYLDFCRLLAKAHRIKLRDLDRALWQWSYEQPAQ